MITEKELEVVNELIEEKRDIQDYRDALEKKEQLVILVENWSLDDHLLDRDCVDWEDWLLTSKHPSIQEKLNKAALNILNERLDEINEESDKVKFAEDILNKLEG